MSKRDNNLLLDDILQSIELIFQYTDDLFYDNLPDLKVQLIKLTDNMNID